ncbi:hypothetical protein [Rhizobium phage RHph_X3_2]|nr:hypothetical protein [Rhizobium phage RHph_X3_2]
MDSPHQMNLMKRRLEQARAEADEMARVADLLANNLAAALNKLLPHDPDFVAALTGGKQEEAAEPAPLSPNEDPPTP